jgi:hypothetical protein
MHDRDVVGQPLGLLDVVRGHQHRDALAAQRRILWNERITALSPGAQLSAKILDPLLDTLAEAA